MVSDALKEASAVLQDAGVEIKAAEQTIAGSSDPKTTEDKSDGHFANYAEYNKTLRTWFVTFGIGGPFLLLTNEAVAAKFADGQLLRWIVYPFLAACSLQVLLAVMNKTSSWYCYHFYEERPKTKDKMRWYHRFAISLGGHSWIDLLFDVGSLALFGISVVSIVLKLVP